MANNGEEVPYGKVDKLVKKYNSNGFKAVTRQNLYYRLSKLKDSKGIDNSGLTGRTVTTSAETQGAISDLTEEPICNDKNTSTTSSTVQVLNTRNTYAITWYAHLGYKTKSHSSNMIKSMKRREKKGSQTHNSPQKTPMMLLRW